jgi:hypothetical protein
MKLKNTIIVGLLCLAFTASIAQDTEEDTGSVIQTLTPSKLISKGKFDIKWFNNLYTQTESTFTEGTEPRQTFFTSTLEGYTGVSENNRVNVGLILEFRSNVVADRSSLDVFSLDGEQGTARSGFTSIAPSVKFVPFSTVGNFSVQSSLFIPLVNNEVENGVFLDQNGFIWQNRFFYDYIFPGDNFQLFTELNTEFNFGKEENSFANNSLNLIPGIFFSYFPSSKFTILVLAQHLQRIDLGNNFEQDYTALGGGAKYQLTNELNVEALYTNFVRGNNTGLGETFNLGLRAVF